MVDGVVVGGSECFNQEARNPKKETKDSKGIPFTEHYQDFRGADLIVVDKIGAYQTSGDHNWKVYKLYAVYGDKRVVSSEVSEMTLTSYYDLWKDKLILAKQKPYILNGDMD